MTQRRNTITTIIGRKGCGKTTRAREEMASSTRRIILDPMLEYHADGVLCRTFADLVRYVEPNRHSRYRVVLQFLDDADRDAAIALATGGTPEKPVGLVYIGLATPTGVEVKRHQFLFDRETFKFFASQTALDMLRRSIATPS